MGHVFVSYSRRDQQFVRTLVEALQQEKVNVWIDYLSIKPGEEWASVIENALTESDALIVVISPNSVESPYVRGEYRLALERGIPVLPVGYFQQGAMLRPQELNNLAFLNVRDFEGNVAAIAKKLVAALPDKVRDLLGTGAPPLAAPSKGYVFISYSGADIEFVKRLRKFMEKHGYAYWDYRKTPRKYAMRFDMELEEAIDNAALVLSVVSPDWKKSPWTAREYCFAEYRGKPNFVLRWRALEDYGGIALLIADRTLIDFTQNENEGFTLLGEALGSSTVTPKP